MNSSQKLSAWILPLGIIVLLTLICLLVWQNPRILHPFADHRLAAVKEGDSVRVRKVKGGVRLEVYSKQEFASENGNESLTSFLNSLPKVKSKTTDRLIITSVDGSSDETYDRSRILELQNIHPVRDATQQFWLSETTLEEAEFQRFGDFSLSDHQILINQVTSSELPVNAALLNATNGNTQADAWAEVRQFRDIEIRDYLASTSDNTDAQEICRSFLQAYIDLTGRSETAQSAEAIEQLAENALAVSSDATVRIYAARHEFNLGHKRDSQQKVNSVLATESGRLSPTTRFIARAFQLSAFRSVDGAVTNSSQLRAITDFIDSSRGFQPVLKVTAEGLGLASNTYRMTWGSLGDKGREQLLKSLFEDPASDPWLCHYLACLWHFQEGWKVRGTKFIFEVPENDRVRFAAELDIAACHALSAYKLRPDLPISVLMLVEMARTGEIPIGNTRSWFIRGIQTQFDFIGFYEAYLLSLTPKWGGSHQEMMDFARACAGCSRFATDVPEFAMECVEALQKDVRQQQNEVARHENVWKRPDVLLLMERFRRSLPVDSADPAIVRRVKDAMERCAAIAVLAENERESRAVFDSIGDGIEYTWFRHYKLPAGPGVRNRIYAETSPARDLVAEFEALVAGEDGFALATADIASTRKKLDDIRAADSHPIHQEYCDRKAEILDACEKFSAGEVVRLPFSRHHQYWDLPTADGVLEENSFQIPPDPDRNDPVYARLSLHIPVPFQLTVDLSLQAESGARNSAGILIADPDVHIRQKPPSGVFIFISRANNGVWWTARGGNPVLIGQTELKPTNRLEVSVYEDRCDVQINGSLRATIPRAPSAARADVLLGSPVFSGTKADSIYRDYFVRKLIE